MSFISPKALSVCRLSSPKCNWNAMPKCNNHFFNLPIKLAARAPTRTQNSPLPSSLSAFNILLRLRKCSFNWIYNNARNLIKYIYDTRRKAEYKNTARRDRLPNTRLQLLNYKIMREQHSILGKMCATPQYIISIKLLDWFDPIYSLVGIRERA